MTRKIMQIIDKFVNKATNDYEHDVRAIFVLMILAIIAFIPIIIIDTVLNILINLI